MSQSPPAPPKLPAVGGDPYVLSPEFYARVRRIVEWGESAIRGRSPAPGRPPRGAAVAGIWAVTNSSIAAGTATTPTSGTVTFRTWDGTTLGADTTTATAFNVHDKTIASGSLVFVSWALGAWWVTDVRSCGNLS